MARRLHGRSKYRRVLLKLSGETLGRKDSGANVDPAAALAVARRVADALDTGAQIGIVIGGGNIIRGAAGGKDGIGRITGDYMGMLATVINALALKDAMERLGLDVCVQSALQVAKVTEPVAAGSAVAHLEAGRTVIFAGGTGNPFFTTDTTAALRAAEIEADALLKATKVDGVYSEDPLRNPRARRFDRISCAEALSRRLKIMDATAFSLCMENAIPIVVFDFFKAGSIRRVLEGRSEGTLVS